MVTIIIPVSRDDYLKRLFGQLEVLSCNPEEVNLLVYVDGDLRLFEKARNLTVMSKFKERLCVYRKKGLANVGSVLRRRQRISDIHNELKTKFNYVAEYDYVFLIEDDTLVPPDALEVLMKDLQENPNAGFVSGVELGRWGFLHVGAWFVDDVNNPMEIVSLPEQEGIVEVDAAGLYCCLMKTSTYINHTFQPYEKILGPDFDFGLALKRQGKQNYVNFDIQCIHMSKKEDITFEGHIIRVKFTKEDDKWKLEEIPAE